MAKTFRVSLKYPDGTTMFMGTVVAEEIIQMPMPERPSSNGRSSAAENGERITDPQKRYLFRLLAAQGLEGKRAEEHLKEYFTVPRVADISKQAASQYIDQLAKDQKDAAS